MLCNKQYPQTIPSFTFSRPLFLSSVPFSKIELTAKMGWECWKWSSCTAGNPTGGQAEARAPNNSGTKVKVGLEWKASHCT